MKMNIKAKTIIIDILLLMITTTVSFVICYMFLDDVFIPPFITEFGRISFRLLVSYLIFISIKWIFNKNVTITNQKVVYILYFVLLVSLSLSRPPLNSQINNINFKFGYIHDISKYIIIVNIFMYFPLGLFAKRFFAIKTRNIIFIFVLYILILEAMQFLLKAGYIDINDIFLNLFGFISGLFVFPLIKKLKKKMIQHLSA